MKRLLPAITAILVVALGVISCAPSSSPSPAPTPLPTVTPTPPSDAISWTDAKYHMGDITTVCGPVVDTQWATESQDKPTILNIGKEYPDPNRFTVVISIHNRGNFPQAPERYYLGKTICVTGLIYPYKGVPQMSVEDPSQIEELD